MSNQRKVHEEPLFMDKGNNDPYIETKLKADGNPFLYKRKINCYRSESKKEFSSSE